MFNKSKYCKPLALLFISFLFFATQINCFADSVGTYKFVDFDKRFLVAVGDGSPSIDVDNFVDIKYEKVAFSSMSSFDKVSSFRFPVQYNSYNKIVMFDLPLSFRSGSEYNINFSYTSNYAIDGNFEFSVHFLSASDENETLDSINLYNGSLGSSYNLNTVDVTFQVPNFNKSFKCVFFAMITCGGGTSTVGQAFFFSDMVISSPDDVPFDKPPVDTSSLAGDIENASDEISSVEADLPKIDIDELEGLMSGFSVDDYVGGFSVLNQIFDEVTTALGVTPLIIFSLSFGLAIYIIGRGLRS